MDIAWSNSGRWWTGGWHAVVHGVVNNWTGLGDRTATTDCWYDTKKRPKLDKEIRKELPRTTAQNHCCPWVIDMFPRVYFGSEVREKFFEKLKTVLKYKI